MLYCIVNCDKTACCAVLGATVQILQSMAIGMTAPLLRSSHTTSSLAPAQPSDVGLMYYFQKDNNNNKNRQTSQKKKKNNPGSLCDKRKELRKKRFEPEGSEKYKKVNNNIKRCMKKAKENWIREQCSETEENLRKNNSKRA